VLDRGTAGLALSPVVDREREACNEGDRHGARRGRQSATSVAAPRADTIASVHRRTSRVVKHAAFSLGGTFPHAHRTALVSEVARSQAATPQEHERHRLRNEHCCAADE
jgi:hypothetical protein